MDINVKDNTNTEALTDDIRNTVIDELAIEARRQYYREYRAKNKDRIREVNKKWREKNPEKFKAAVKKWQKAHPERMKELQRNFYLRKLEERMKDNKPPVEQCDKTLKDKKAMALDLLNNYTVGGGD